MVEQLRREFVQGPAFDLQGYLGMGGRGGVGSSGRVEPTQFPGVQGGSVNFDLGRGGGGGGGGQQQQPGAIDSFLQGFGGGAGQALATGIPEKILQFQQEQRREKSLSAVDRALNGKDLNDPQSVLQAIVNAKGVDPETRKEVIGTYLAGQQAQNERLSKIAPYEKAAMQQQQQQVQEPQFENALNIAYGAEEQPNQPQVQQQAEPQQQEQAQAIEEDALLDQEIPQDQEKAVHQQIIQQELAQGRIEPTVPLPLSKFKPPVINMVSSTKVPSPQQFAKAIRGLPDAQKKMATAAYNKTRQMSYDEVESAYKETEEYRDSVSQGYKYAQITKNTFDEMDDLIESDKISSPLVIKGIEMAGLPLAILGNPENEIFEKYSNTLKQGVNDAYRGALKVTELQTFDKTIPTLHNSKEAKKEVLKKMRLENRVKELEFDALNHLTLLNGGHPYKNIRNDVAKYIAPQIEELYAQSRQQPEEIGEQWVQMTNPQTGEAIEVHPDDIEKAQSKGFR